MRGSTERWGEELDEGRRGRKWWYENRKVTLLVQGVRMVG